MNLGAWLPDAAEAMPQHGHQVGPEQFDDGLDERD
jgi:hypothetical protein